MKQTLFEMHEPPPERPKVMAERVARPGRQRKRRGGSMSEYALLPTIAEFPPGAGEFVRIEEGPVLSDDLVWSCMHREWLRGDDSKWILPATLAEDCVYVIRSVIAIRRAIDADRNYTIRY